MGARKLLYHVPLIWGNKEIAPKKMALFSKGNTGNFSENSSKNCLDYFLACPMNTGFGMLACPVNTGLPNRHEAGNEYRYGFQGQEKDDEIKGEGNSINYKYRMHDPRVGRFFAVDPLAAQYPHYSPYSFSGNEVINRVELEGLEPSKEMASQDPGLNAVKATNAEKIQYKTSKAMMLAAGSGPFAFAIAYYGTAAVAAFITEEAVEYALEKFTGVPIIVNPVDLVKWFAKKGYKKITKDAIQKYGDDFIANAKKFAKPGSVSKRHKGALVKFSSTAKKKNTVVDKSWDFDEDYAKLRQGEGVKDGNKYTLENGHEYTDFGDGVKPTGGTGSVTLNRAEYKALGYFNENGYSADSVKKLTEMGYDKVTIDNAKKAYDLVNK